MPTTDVFATVITPLANKQDAIDLGGGYSYAFSAFATPTPPNEDTGEWDTQPEVLYVLGSGYINPSYLSAYQAAAAASPGLYYVDTTPPWSHALAHHPLGPLYRYIPPEV